MGLWKNGYLDARFPPLVLGTGFPQNRSISASAFVGNNPPDAPTIFWLPMIHELDCTMTFQESFPDIRRSCGQAEVAQRERIFATRGRSRLRGRSASISSKPVFGCANTCPGRIRPVFAAETHDCVGDLTRLSRNFDNRTVSVSSMNGQILDEPAR